MTTHPQAARTNNTASNGGRRNDRFKTVLCRSFQRTRRCKYGDRCQFAHGEEELRQPPRPKNYKSVKCNKFWKFGVCPYGDRCMFLHDEKEELPGGICPTAPAIPSAPSTTEDVVRNSSGGNGGVYVDARGSSMGPVAVAIPVPPLPVAVPVHNEIPVAVAVPIPHAPLAHGRHGTASSLHYRNPSHVPASDAAAPGLAPPSASSRVFRTASRQSPPMMDAPPPGIVPGIDALSIADLGIGNDAKFDGPPPGVSVIGGAASGVHNSVNSRGESLSDSSIGSHSSNASGTAAPSIGLQASPWLNVTSDFKDESSKLNRLSFFESMSVPVLGRGLPHTSGTTTSTQPAVSSGFDFIPEFVALSRPKKGASSQA